MSQDDQVQPSGSKSVSDVIFDEAEESGYMNGKFYDRIYNIAEKFAGSGIGQYATGKIDRILKLIEDTAKWSLPPRNLNKNESSIPLERPLPWIPFIALIFMLRLVRVGLSIAGLFIGNAPLVPSDVVYFIQTRRRKLRSIRIAGMKEIQRKEQKYGHVSRRGLFSSLTAIISMAFCRPQLYEDVNNVPDSEDCSVQAECSGAPQTKQNHKSSEIAYEFNDPISDHELTLDQILDKYAASSNEDDSDFKPPADALLDADTSATSSATSDEDANNTEEYENKVQISNPDTNLHTTNGNISTESDELHLENKVNGGHQLGKKLKKSKVMPKPLKEEDPVPLPIQEIKHEQLDSGEDNFDTEPQEEHDSSKASSFFHLPLRQSIVEDENYNQGSISNTVSQNGTDQHLDGINGYQKLPKSDMFVTPATSAEDLFFSPVGSPDLGGAFGFHPKSILKNPLVIDSKEKGHTDTFSENEDFIRGEISNNSEMEPNQSKSVNNSGKQIKNKLRGKRR